MNIRRTAAIVAAAAVVATSLTFGIAAPASAATIVIPTCAQMLADPPSYPDSFAAANGGAAPVAFRPVHRYYGSANSTLKNFLRSWGAKKCSWHAAKIHSHNFTISEVRLNKARAAQLKRWMNSHGIVGTDVEATMGGILYQVSAHEWSLLVHDSVWITMVERHTSIFGYTMQAASYSLYDLNPSL